MVGRSSALSDPVAAHLLPPGPPDRTRLRRCARQSHPQSQTKTPAGSGGGCEPTPRPQRSLAVSAVPPLSGTGSHGGSADTQTGETCCLSVRPTMWNDLELQNLLQTKADD